MLQLLQKLAQELECTVGGGGIPALNAEKVCRTIATSTR